MANSTRTDVVIIGGGPAGLSAATWCTDLGLSSILIEREAEIGGQLTSIHGPIENYIGLRADNGRELLAHFCETLDRFDFLRLSGIGVTGVDPASMSARLSDGDVVTFSALISATGVRRRRLDIPGETEFRGKGVIESGVRDGDLVTGKHVVIVGGGDAAIENALLLAERAASVIVVHRRSALRARRDFIVALDARGDVEVKFETIVTKIVGDTVVTAVELKDISTGQVITHPVDIVLIRIGVEPNSEPVGELVELDERGYIKVNSSCETSIPGIFAIGDVANPDSLTISTACGTGATAARSVYRLLNGQRHAV